MGDGSRTMMTTALGKPSVHHFNAFNSKINVKSHSECIRNPLVKHVSHNKANKLSVIIRKTEAKIIYNAHGRTNVATRNVKLTLTYLAV